MTRPLVEPGLEKVREEQEFDHVAPEVLSSHHFLHLLFQPVLLNSMSMRMK